MSFRDRVFRLRDLTIIEVGENQVLVLACDSSGAIGPKELDRVQVSGELLGKEITGVALKEVLAAGAEPIALMNTLSVEMDPTGKDIIRGIVTAAKEAGLDSDAVINGSTEENIPVAQTGIGVTVIGTAAKDRLRPGSSQKGDRIVCVGVPKVGPEVLEDQGEIVTVEMVKTMAGAPFLHDILPVGSKGIRYEMDQLVLNGEGTLEIFRPRDLDLVKSAGPATCVLVTLAPQHLTELTRMVSVPCTVIGEIR